MPIHPENIDRDPIRQLTTKGIASSAIPGFLWSLKSCFRDDPDMNCSKLNKKLKRLGWPGLQVDPHTFSIARHLLNDFESYRSVRMSE